MRSPAAARTVEAMDDRDAPEHALAAADECVRCGAQSEAGDRLRPRHHVIARLAREGFCTTTLTTNYDRLLEGAFRASGFWYGGCERFSPETYFKEFACIASPLEFFTDGKAHRTAVLMKIHGCSRRYRG